MEAKSEIRDGMRIDWDVADPHGRRHRSSRRYLPSDGGRPIPGHPELRPLRQGPLIPGRLQGPLGQAGESCAGGAGRLEQQVPELGVGRSGEMGAGRLCLPAHRLARRRPLAGLPRRLVRARDAGPLPVRRMGRHAALEQRQGRHQRHFLLRDEPVDRRRPDGPLISPPCASGKARPTTIASSAATAASSATSSTAGIRARSRACSTESARAAKKAS